MACDCNDAYKPAGNFFNARDLLFACHNQNFDVEEFVKEHFGAKEVYKNARKINALKAKIASLEKTNAEILASA